MARPLRLEFAGALYHVTSRGDRREDIYLDDEDRQEWFTVLAEVCDRFNWVVHAYCEMSNHYHLLVETVDGNLSRGMRQLNGLFTQRFNRKHKQVGHLFQGRYKAILVQKEAHLLELARYVVLNPVRAGMVDLPEDWPWSSYDYCMHDKHAPEWLDTDWLLGQFGSSRKRARVAYAKFVLEGVGLPSPLLATRHQLLLGDDEFVEKYQHQLRPEDLREVSLAHRRSIALPLATYQQQYINRDEAMYRAYHSGAYTMAEIAEFFTVHYMTVSRAVRKFEAQ
ncbi:REP-associated tyrosine transposase [Undibacterium sp. TC4M20W]|uniref:REP-associated tyrosine transposase n=1 Tax=Undibacterium sp. TC4M20W TaxID=3413052 RepID=UPI003BF439EE